MGWAESLINDAESTSRVVLKSEVLATRATSTEMVFWIFTRYQEVLRSGLTSIEPGNPASGKRWNSFVWKRWLKELQISGAGLAGLTGWR